MGDINFVPDDEFELLFTEVPNGWIYQELVKEPHGERRHEVLVFDCDGDLIRHMLQWRFGYVSKKQMVDLMAEVVNGVTE